MSTVFHIFGLVLLAGALLPALPVSPALHSSAQTSGATVVAEQTSGDTDAAEQTFRDTDVAEQTFRDTLAAEPASGAPDAAKPLRTGCIPVGSLAKDSLAFKGGETMSFTVHYNWGIINSDVGTATVRLEETDFNGIPSFHCSVSGRTTRLYDLVFRVREQFDSWFTRDGVRPLKFTRDTHEGKYDALNTYFYDWERSVIVADVYSSSSGQRNLELPLDKCTYDLPALFFLARNMDMSVVTPEIRYPMTFAIDDDVYNVHFILHGRETIDVKGLGRINTIKFSARLLAGEVFRSDTDMTIYISDDDNRLPVYFEAPLLVGKASGRMTSCTNLAHPFSSKADPSR